MPFTFSIDSKIKLSLIIVVIAVAFNGFSMLTFDSHAQQEGGAATGGSATGGASIGGEAPCYGNSCSYNYYGGSATGGSATNNVGVTNAPPLDNSITPNDNFYSSNDVFVTSEPTGYGIYEERASNIFKPGEPIILNIDPVGFKYKVVTDTQGKPLYSIDFDASFVIYDKEGNVLAGPNKAPVGSILSHYKNKEIFIPFTINQSTPFPSGDYVIKYIIVDENSSNVLELNKNITISGT
jgi:hypothetical protein